ncbi:MAG: hypothetical protein EOP82_16925 [Variovorax sp.]|nr:MAG: hypothetical protein EOP82_16925 [Variovorax sp.]
MNLSSAKLFIKSHHPSNRLRVSAGNRVNLSRDRLRTRIHVKGKDNRVYIDPSARLRDVSIELSGNGNTLTVGKNAMLLGGRIEMFGDGSEIHLGDGFGINGGFIGAHWGTTITVGDGCVFSSATDVRTTDSHSIVDDNTGRRINEDRNIRLGERVWLGRGASVTKGAVIGNDVMVAAMAVVTGKQDVPPHSMVGGIPAKVIRSGISWSTERL